MIKLLLLSAFCIFVAGHKDAGCRPRRGPHNGQVSYTVRDGGLVARFRCDTGHRLLGSPFAVCLGGLWRHPVPICLLKWESARKETSRKDDAPAKSLLFPRGKWRLNKLEQNDSPPAPVTSTPTSSTKKYRKIGNHAKRKKDKRKLKQKAKGKGNVADGQQLEQDEEFLSKLDLSCLIGSGGAGFIKAPEVSHAVIKYARLECTHAAYDHLARHEQFEQPKVTLAVGDPSGANLRPLFTLIFPLKDVKRNERGSQNRYLLATYDCVRGFTLKNKRNDRMFCSQSRWLGTKPKCQKQEVKEENASETSLCSINRGGCEHICKESRNKVTCSCYHGFRSEGNRCIDVDECEVNNGGCEHICKNQLGSFTCSCPSGLQLSSNGKTCVDINECLSRNGHGPCQDTCTNHWGGYRCSCEGIPGTQLSEDNHTCEDIDECKSGVAGCSHSCINALGRAFCQCPPGLELGEDWKTCQDIDECDDEVIESTCEFGCINTVGSYRCASENEGSEEVSPEPDLTSTNNCLKGYTRGIEGKCIDIDECKENTHNCSHECVNREGDYECVCPDGYDLSENERTCDDYDECAEDIEPEHNCSQKCINEMGSYRCDCYKGYILDADSTSCLDVDECASDPCKYTCKNVAGGFLCFCPDGYEALNHTECVDVDECIRESHNCTHGCVNTIGSYQCICPLGMTWSDDSCIDVDECEINNGNCSQICKNTVGSRDCQCGEGYRLQNGTICEDVDECAEGRHLCPQSCENNLGSYSCNCRDGFAAEGDNCVDVNECLMNNGNCSDSCINHDGGYECQCSDGYRLKNLFECEDVDECETENQGCSQSCENTDGSFFCRCHDGYILGEDGKSCEDVDECAHNNGNCSQLCVNSDGDFRCACREHYELESDNSTCSAIDLCLTQNGGCDQVCIMANEVRTCSCFDGYNLAADQKTCEEEDKCARCEQLCEKTSGICSCRKGYELSNDGKTCKDVDECEVSPCAQVCINTDGGYECDCYDGYRLSETDNRTCEDVNECLEWEYDMEYYDNKLDYGEPANLCSHTCVNLPGGYTCYCPAGYGLAEDDRTCSDIDECAQNHGGCDHICVNHDGGYECKCRDGYLSDNYTKCVDINECDSHNGNCSQICENRDGGFECHCLDGYELAVDKRTCIRKCALKNGLCSDLCVENRGVAECRCSEGLKLQKDGLNCDDIDECGIANGGCAQICNNTIGSFKCSCADGYVAEGNACRLINPCTVDNGQCSHICSFEDGEVSCSCREGYELDADSRRCICPAGYFDTDHNCRDVDECLEGLSNCSDSCINTVGSYRCECPPGLETAADGRTCRDINECLHDNGGCSHECVNTIGSYNCKCRKGYKLLNKTKCLDSNPCEIQNGGCEQICRSKNGKVKCSCYPGYARNESFCEDINECEGNHDCSQLCANTIGSYECKCKPGYLSDGKLCTDMDECNMGTCPGKKCVNTIGSYYCECHPGYKLINDQCIDINECVTQRPCQGRCINTMGSYKCVCHTGFKEKNGACSDLNECEIDNGGCSHICINFPGSYKCLCPIGFELHNKTCKDVNECSKSNGGCDHICINTEGSYTCSCKDHFYLLDDKKTCRVSGKSCPKLMAPPFAEIRCPQFPYSTDEFPLNSECYIRCRKGYKLGGDTQRVCTSSGEWSGRNAECIPLPCPKLKAPENGHFIPSSCTTGKSPPSHHCILACNKGYHVQGRAVLTCLNSQQWNSPVPNCTKDTPPPYIQCAPDIKTELPSNKLSVFVKIPQPKSNVDWWRYVEAHPPWAKNLEGQFPLGTTTIMFQARNPTSNLTAACRLLIHVYDNEKPRVSNCPESFVVRLSPKETGKTVTWKEPVFTDNVKIDHIDKSQEPGSLFRPGYHPIRYTATDSSGNKALCNFTVTVKYEDRVSPVDGKESFRKVVICPQLSDSDEYYPSYILPTRCFVQKHRLTRVLTGFADYQAFQSHGVRHQHDRANTNLRFGGVKNYYGKRRDDEKDQSKLLAKMNGKLRMVDSSGKMLTDGNQSSESKKLEYRGTIPNNLARNETIFLDTQVVIDQKNHQSDLARWQDVVKTYRSSAGPPLSASNHERNVRLLEMETKRRYEEERLRNHELEMRRWRENMRRYHLEMKRLQEDSRRYRAG